VHLLLWLQNPSLPLAWWQPGLPATQQTLKPHQHAGLKLIVTAWSHNMTAAAAAVALQVAAAVKAVQVHLEVAALMTALVAALLLLLLQLLGTAMLVLVAAASLLTAWAWASPSRRWHSCGCPSRKGAAQQCCDSFLSPVCRSPAYMGITMRLHRGSRIMVHVSRTAAATAKEFA
jgi:hypothetical protein